MSLPGIPARVRRVHLIGICGTGMGSLAGLLSEAGYEVGGSDESVYPPMSTMLRDQGIVVQQGFDAAHLEPPPDLVVVGNIATRFNPEALAASERGIPYLRMPQAIGRLFLEGRHSLVVAGTHGKTSTAARLAWVLASGGRDPSFLIGGVLRNFDRSYGLGGGKDFVIEGDEYATAYFDQGSKFLHYQPKTAILTSIEFDHAEMFADLDAVKATFRTFVALLPPDGLLVCCADDPNVAESTSAARCRVETYGLSDGALWRAEMRGCDERGTDFEVWQAGESLGLFRSPLCGMQNLQNVLAVIAATRGRGLSLEAISAGLREFGGIRRRQEVRGVAGGVTVIDDFAHHPTAVRLTLGGIRERYPQRTIWAVFEPRTNTSRRNVFQAEYAASFAAVDRVVIAAVDHAERIPEADRFSPTRLVEDLRASGQDAMYFPDVPPIVAQVAAQARPGDVVVVMSNGAFGGIHDKLLAALGGKG